MLSSNITYPDGKYPKEWKPSTVIKFPGGVDLGIVGFTTDVIPTLFKPGALDPFLVGNSLARGQHRGVKALTAPTDAVVALGHEGANAGTVTDPTGPARRHRGRRPERRRRDGRPQRSAGPDAVRPNGVLVTENRAKGIRFTRVRMVLGPGKDGVVYTTADSRRAVEHRRRPDAAIQAKIQTSSTWSWSRSSDL